MIIGLQQFLMNQTRSMKSTQSVLLPSINVSVTSFNPLASIPSHVINLIKKNGQTFIGCTEKCEQIWQKMKKNHTKQSNNISGKMVEMLFHEYATDFKLFLKLNNSKEFMETFDRDQDGFLNQDQQIAVFNVLKQRLMDVTSNLLKIQSYSMHKSLMKQVRLLQKKITKWQDYFRQRICCQQLQQYSIIGQTKVEEFYQKYDEEFRLLEELKQNRRGQLEIEYMRQVDELEAKLNSATQQLKIKPKRKLKELQVQEKLVSLEERVEEALDFRRQLNELQKSEKNRIDKMNLQNEMNLRKMLKIKHEKKQNQLEVAHYHKVKLQELENKLIIKMRIAYDVLLKKNKLHQNQIKRIQGLQKKWALKKGIFEPQLKRTKILQRNRNQILRKANAGKQLQNVIETIQQKKQQKKYRNQHNRERKGAKQVIIQMIQRGSLTTFNLNSKYQSNLPINYKYKAHQIRHKNKIYKFLKEKKKLDYQMVPSLCNLYDQNLQEIKTKIFDRNNQSQQKERKKSNILEKIFRNSKL